MVLSTRASSSLYHPTIRRLLSTRWVGGGGSNSQPVSGILTGPRKLYRPASVGSNRTVFFLCLLVVETWSVGGGTLFKKPSRRKPISLGFWIAVFIFFRLIFLIFSWRNVCFAAFVAPAFFLAGTILPKSDKIYSGRSDVKPCSGRATAKNTSERVRWPVCAFLPEFSGLETCERVLQRADGHFS